MKKWLITYCLVVTTHLLMAQQPAPANYHANSRFEQMGTAMPKPMAKKNNLYFLLKIKKP